MSPAIHVAARGPYRVRVTGTLTLDGPWHVGTGERLSILTDAPVLLSPGKLPYLPGSSIRGVLRDHLEREARVLGVPWRSVLRLFGNTDEDPDNSGRRGPGNARGPAHGADPAAHGERTWDRQGRLVVSDARLCAPEPSPPPTTRIRDHVRTDLMHGAADHGAKFDLEVTGKASLCLELSYEGDGAGDPELVLLREAIRALEGRELAFGAKSGWGHGRARLTDTQWTVSDRSDEVGLSWFLISRLPGGWGLSNSDASLMTDAGVGSPAETDVGVATVPVHQAEVAGATHGNEAAVQPGGDGVNGDAPGESARTFPEMPPPPAKWRDPWNLLELTLTLKFDGPTLVGGPGRPGVHAEEDLQTDAVFFVNEDGAYTLPGSSVRGVLRSEFYRIAATHATNRDGANARAAAAEGRVPRLETPCAVQTLFGTMKRSRQAAGMDEAAEDAVAGSERRSAAGLLSFGDGVLSETGVHRIKLDHVAIDRLTGFAADARLFNATALASPTFEVPLRLRWHGFNQEHLEDILLFLFVLRDLQQGWIWMGGKTTRGYGHVANAEIVVNKASTVDWRDATEAELLGWGVGDPRLIGPHTSGPLTAARVGRGHRLWPASRRLHSLAEHQRPCDVVALQQLIRDSRFAPRDGQDGR